MLCATKPPNFVQTTLTHIVLLKYLLMQFNFNSIYVQLKNGVKYGNLRFKKSPILHLVKIDPSYFCHILGTTLPALLLDPCHGVIFDSNFSFYFHISSLFPKSDHVVRSYSNIQLTLKPCTNSFPPTYLGASTS